MGKRPQSTDILYLATKRHVVAVVAASGEEIWRTKLQGIQSGAVISLLIRPDRIFAAGHGHVYCLARSTGKVLWFNDLPQLGYQSVILAMDGTDPSQQALAAQVQAMARHNEGGAAAAAATG